MTSFETQAMLGTTLSPLVAVDKGDVTNRVQCSAAQAGNTLKHLAADTVVIGGAAVPGKQALKGGKFAQFLAKPVNAFQNFFSSLAKEIKVDNARRLNHNKKFGLNSKIAEKLKDPKLKSLYKKPIKNYPERIANYLKKIPTKYKALAVIAAVALPLVNYINQRFSYRAGQIDQKYTDKAAIMRSGRKFV